MPRPQVVTRGAVDEAQDPRLAAVRQPRLAVGTVDDVERLRVRQRVEGERAPVGGYADDVRTADTRDVDASVGAGDDAEGVRQRPSGRPELRRGAVALACGKARDCAAAVLRDPDVSGAVGGHAVGPAAGRDRDRGLEARPGSESRRTMSPSKSGAKSLPAPTSRSKTAPTAEGEATGAPGLASSATQPRPVPLLHPVAGGFEKYIRPLPAAIPPARNPSPASSWGRRERSAPARWHRTTRASELPSRRPTRARQARWSPMSALSRRHSG